MEKCACGRVHPENTTRTAVGKNALRELMPIVTESGCKNILLVADVNTHRLAGNVIKEILESFSLREYIYDDESLIPDERAVGRLVLATYTESAAPADMLVALGSGTINDICRYVSYRLNIPYIIVATAASMDGYASGVSPLIVNNLKTTYETKTAYAIIGDTALLRTASPEMTGAGFADIIGKYNCINDWELSRIVNDEYYCEEVAAITRSSIKTCVEHHEGLAESSDSALESLMDALILSGIAMSYVGNSRPASGAEHHLSHFWEMMFLMKHRAPVLHGAKVGVATLVMIKLLEMLQTEPINWDAILGSAENSTPAEYSRIMKQVYGHAAPEIIAAAKKDGRNSSEDRLCRLYIYRDRWQDILDIIRKNIPEYEIVKEMLEKACAPVSPVTLGIDREDFINGILYAKELRSRFTVLQMAADLDLLPRYAEILAENYY